MLTPFAMLAIGCASEVDPRYRDANHGPDDVTVAVVDASDTMNAVDEAGPPLPLSCEASPPMPCEVLYGADSDPCRAWARSLLGGDRTAYAFCDDGVCRRGDATMGESTALCGMHPECAPGWTCVVPDILADPFNASCVIEPSCADAGR